MKILSHEYLQNLQDELMLVNYSIGVLRDRGHVYAKEHGANHLTNAGTSLSTKKIELELKIEALQRFLFD